VYLHWLAEYAARYQLCIWAYCLMTNHIHLVVTPSFDLALARTMQAVQSRYSSRMNKEYHWNGHLWQGRFFSCPLDESYFWQAIRYVERNPLRARITERAEEYRWSSAAAHCGLVTDPLLAPLPAENMIAPDGWSGWLDGEDGDELLILRAGTLSGRPCGSPDFVENLSTVMGRSLHAKPRGRPRKNITSLEE